MAQPNLTSDANNKMQAYFSAIAPSYNYLTGNTTKALIAQTLQEIKLGITGNSIIHDNGCGPGNATEAVLDFCTGLDILPPNIIATDCNETMINAVRERQAKSGGPNQAGGTWSTVEARVMDSHALQYDNDKFNYSFCNNSIATYADPLQALKEIHRTLKPAGIAVVTCWKFFGPAEVIRRTQKRVKGDDYKPSTTPYGENFFREGYLVDLMDDAGWELGKVKSTVQKVVVKEGTPEMEGLTKFLRDWTEQGRAGWSDEENTQWPSALDEVIKEEVREHGGIMLEAWVVLARKWDALYA